MALAQLWQVVEEACVLIGARAQGLEEGGGIFVKSTIRWINLGWIFSSLFDHVPRTIYRFNRSTYGFFLLAAQNLTKVAKYDLLQQFRQILWKVHENRHRSIYCLWVGIATRHERQHSKSGNSTKLIWVRPLNVNNTNRWCTGCPLPLMHILVLNALGEKKLSVPMTSDILFRMCTSLHGLSTWMTFLKSPAKHDRLSCTIRDSCGGGEFYKHIWNCYKDSNEFIRILFWRLMSNISQQGIFCQPFNKCQCKIGLPCSDLLNCHFLSSCHQSQSATKLPMTSSFQFYLFSISNIMIREFEGDPLAPTS